MTQRCYSCGRETPLGEPFRHYFGCQVGGSATSEVDRKRRAAYERVGAGVRGDDEHYYVCKSCGQAVDMRQLPQVIHHERDGHGRMGRGS